LPAVFDRGKYFEPTASDQQIVRAQASQNSVRQSCGDVADSNAAIAAAQELEIRKPCLPQLDEIARAQAYEIRGRVELEDKIFAGLIACLPVRVDDKEGVARE
jgi:hypothetical protein